uniref:Uncharacterized protein n=1 Tax=Trichuris muris TaxID=70415 RepID=A0A5S6Q6P5_TRIMR
MVGPLAERSSNRNPDGLIGKRGRSPGVPTVGASRISAIPSLSAFLQDSVTIDPLRGANASRATYGGGGGVSNGRNPCKAFRASVVRRRGAWQAFRLASLLRLRRFFESNKLAALVAHLIININSCRQPLRRPARERGFVAGARESSPRPPTCPLRGDSEVELSSLRPTWRPF